MTRGDSRRDDLMDFIIEYRKTNGYSPSVAEMADGLGTVKSNVHRHLQALREEGRISFAPGKSRSWAPIA